MGWMYGGVKENDTKMMFFLFFGGTCCEKKGLNEVEPGNSPGDGVLYTILTTNGWRAMEPIAILRVNFKF
jgi:hypothetical protein